MATWTRSARRLTTDTIVWYENNGSQSFTRYHEISTVADRGGECVCGGRG